MDSRGAEPQPAAIAASGASAERVGDHERDGAAALLRDHLSAGRLTLDEFSERVGTALVARTRGELEAALADLPAARPPPGQRTPARRMFVALLGGSSWSGRYRLSSRARVVAVMGGCQLDLRRAELIGPELVIDAVAVMGGIEIVVPEGIDVEMTGVAVLGGKSVEVRDVPPLPGSPRVLIRAFPLMGAVTARSVPSGERLPAPREGLLEAAAGPLPATGAVVPLAGGRAAGALADAPGVVDDAAAQRLTIGDGDELSELVYRRQGGRLLLVHTFVPEPLRGGELGDRLVRAALAKAAAEGLTVVPRCSFVRHWLERHGDVASGQPVDWERTPTPTKEQDQP